MSIAELNQICQVTGLLPALRLTVFAVHIGASNA